MLDTDYVKDLKEEFETSEFGFSVTSLQHDVWVVMVSELNDTTSLHYFADAGLPVYVYEKKADAEKHVAGLNKLWLTSTEYQPEFWKDECTGPWWIAGSSLVQP